MTWRLIHADCIEAMAAMEPDSVDAIVADPPYGIGFMGHEWDQPGFDTRQPGDETFHPSGSGPHDRAKVRYGAGASKRRRQPDPATGAGHPRERKRLGGPTGERHTGGTGSSTAGGAMHAGRYDLSPPAMQDFQRWCALWGAEAIRVLKPGGHLVSFGGPRTYHRLACGLEDAGFEVRDCLAWLFGSGFPKSLDVSKAIDKAAGAEREVVGDKLDRPGYHLHDGRGEGVYGDGEGLHEPGTDARLRAAQITAPATPDAERWQGWGTALKPAYEPVVLARKPLSERNVAANVLRWGTGALNIDGCRIDVTQAERDAVEGREWVSPEDRTAYQAFESDGTRKPIEYAEGGRWPANVALDPDAAALLDEQAPNTGGGGFPGAAGGIGNGQVYGAPGSGRGLKATGRVDPNGGASRFFYVAKADRAEREIGRPPDAVERELNWSSGDQNPGSFQAEGTNRRAWNHHPTVKPVELMQWLVRMVTPPGGLVLDPFAGSGSTLMAACREGFDCVGIERDESYVEIARARILGDGPLFNVEAEVPA